MTTPYEDRDCTENCKSTVHGDLITSAITKRGVSDTELCAYLSYVCCCCESVRDSDGRTALQVAASCGRLELVRWLLEVYKQINVGARDYESLYSALHRSFFYGKIDVAVNLIKFGANVMQTDGDGLTVLEHIMKDRKHKNFTTDGEIYVWGSNANYTLGPQSARSVPEIMDAFHKANPHVSVKQICLSTFHCVIVGMDRKVYVLGHGQGGRLGSGSEHAVLVPTAIKFTSRGYTGSTLCVQASIALDHSLFLMESGQIWACGLNTHRVLGIDMIQKQLLVPRPLNLLQHRIKGICALTYHSVAWGSNCIYTWGLNGGQIGLDRNGSPYISTPKALLSFTVMDVNIKAVASSIGAIAYATAKGDIYVLHEFQCRKIASRQLDVADLSVVGGRLQTPVNISTDSQQLQVLVLTENGNLHLWQENDPHLCRCIFSLTRVIVAKQAMLNVNHVLLVTTDGEAFQGEIRDRKKRTVDNSMQKSAFHKFLEKDDCRMVKVVKIPRIHRAISFVSDLEGRNYAVLQMSPGFFLINIPEINTSRFQEDMHSFLEGTDVTDQIHDITFKIGNRMFPAHQYIVGHRSPKLKDLMSAENSGIIELKCVDPDIFYQMLLFIYTGSCDLMKPGVCPIQINGEDVIKKVIYKDEINHKKGISAYEYNKLKKMSTEPQIVEIRKPKDPLKMLSECARHFEVKSLNNTLNGYSYQNGHIKRNAKIDRVFHTLDRKALPEFYDLRIKTKNGKEIPVHKCVLVARMEYFANMFSLRWDRDSTGNQEISLPYPIATVEYLVDYLYTDILPAIEKEDTDLICSLLVLADEYFVPHLKELCESVLSSTITLKNAPQILSFAAIYNAQQLKACCMEFVCSNLAAMVELGTLNEVEDVHLTELARFYCEWNPVMSQRVITPYSTAASDEEVRSVAAEFPVPREIVPKPKPVKRRPRSHRALRTSEGEKEGYSPLVEIKIEPLQFEETAVLEVPNRLKAINSAMERIKSEVTVENFATLDGEFPELGSPPAVYSRSPKNVTESKVRFQPKLSQKQRKRLSSEGSVKEMLLSESPKNPWKIVNETSPIGSPECKIDIIVNLEKKQKENFSKMLSKSLLNTQKEDKAIEDLYKFYNVENVFDELISIERVSVDLVAAPVWVQKTKQL